MIAAFHLINVSQAVNNICIFLMFSHTECKARLIRSHRSSPTVIQVACAREGSGIQCVERTGSPTRLRAWRDACPPLALAETRSDTHHWRHDTLYWHYDTLIFLRWLRNAASYLAFSLTFHSYHTSVSCCAAAHLSWLNVLFSSLFSSYFSSSFSSLSGL